MFAIRLDPIGGAGSCDAVPDDATLSELLANAFGDTDGAAHMTWNDIEFRLAYRYDAAEISSSIVDLLGDVCAHQTGTRDVNLATSSFPLAWSVEWDRDTLRIEARAAFSAAAKARLRGREVVEMNRRDFVRTWLPLLKLWRDRVEAVGYGDTDSIELVELRRVIDSIE